MRSNSPSCRTRSSFACSSRGRSPISSRNSVPRCASSKRPWRCETASVKAPFSWPNSSLSISVGGSAAVDAQSETAGASCAWIARAKSSLPVLSRRGAARCCPWSPLPAAGRARCAAQAVADDVVEAFDHRPRRGARRPAGVVAVVEPRAQPRDLALLLVERDFLPPPRQRAREQAGDDAQPFDDAFGPDEVVAADTERERADEAFGAGHRDADDHRRRHGDARQRVAGQRREDVCVEVGRNPREQHGVAIGRPEFDERLQERDVAIDVRGATAAPIRTPSPSSRCFRHARAAARDRCRASRRDGAARQRGGGDAVGVHAHERRGQLRNQVSVRVDHASSGRVMMVSMVRRITCERTTMPALTAQ